MFEKYRRHNRMVDVESAAVAAIEEIIERVGRGDAMSPAIEKVAAGLIDGFAIVGQEQLVEWQRRLEYSDDLARAQVKAHIAGLLPPEVLYKLHPRAG